MPDRPLRIVVRADGSASIGLGHVMRSLTLARALCDLGCDVSFEGAGIPDVVRAALPLSLRVLVHSEVRGDGRDAASVADRRPDLVIADGYHFTMEFFETLEAGDICYAVIDDNAETSASAPAVVLNQNPHASEHHYQNMLGKPKLLLGLEYALIRPEITRMAQERLRRVPHTILLAMGGSDPLELTAPIAESVAPLNHDVLVALGPAHPSRDTVVQRLTGIPNVAIIGPGEFVKTLATCELAVLAAGSSLWEAACLGTPTIGVVVAENQRQGASAALRLGLLEGLHDLTRDSLQRLVGQVEDCSRAVTTPHSVSDLVDGRGARRAARTLVSAIL